MPQFFPPIAPPVLPTPRIRLAHLGSLNTLPIICPIRLVAAEVGQQEVLLCVHLLVL